MSPTPRPRSKFRIFNIPACLAELSASQECRKYLLVTGPSLAVQPQIEDGGGVQNTSLYLKSVVTKVIEWCIDRNILKQEYIVDEFRRLLQKEALAHIGYKLEEYLVEKSWLQHCLAEVLLCDTEIASTYLSLVRIPFRGYISTTYDTFIETAYEQIHRKKLPKYYASSIQGAVEACQQKRPFLLKPYGDISNPESIILGHRLAKGLFAVNGLESLRSIFAVSPVLFAGFEENDLDLKILNDIIRDSTKTSQRFHAKPLVHDIRPTAPEDRHCRKSESRGNTIHEFPQNREVIPLSSVTDTHIFQNIYAGLVAKGSQVSTPSSRTREESRPKIPQRRPIEVFTAYTEKDKKYFDKINEIVEAIQNTKRDWCIDYKKAKVYKNTPLQTKLLLTSADLVLLLVSTTFLTTDFSNCEEMKKAVDRQGPKFCLLPIRVYPIAIDIWKEALFGRLDVLPEGDKALSELGAKQGQILKQIMEAILKKIQELRVSNRRG